MTRRRKTKSRQESAQFSAQTSTQPQATTSRIADDAPYQLWCLVQGDSTLFTVTPPTNIDIDDLKKLIHELCKYGVLRGVDAVDLVLLKVDHPMPDDEDVLSTLEFNDHRLSSQHPVSKYWPKPPPNDKIHIFVKPPAISAGLKRERSLDDDREEDAKRRLHQRPDSGN